MNYALIFAGGVGSRMGSETPKQFIEVNGKPIIVHTIAVFDDSKIIDKIVVVTLPEYIHKVEEYIVKFNLFKVSAVISGGGTAMESQFNGLKFIKKTSNENDLVFIHDGVRPFINNKLLEDCLNSVRFKGNAITVCRATETISILNSNNQIEKILPRQKCILARAPQAFFIDDIYNAHLKVGNKRNDFVDSASLMMSQNVKLNIVEGPSENIKITTQYDLMLCELWMNKNEKD